VRFDYLGGAAYVRCAGGRSGWRNRRFLAWSQAVGTGPAARKAGHIPQSKGRQHGQRRERILRHPAGGPDYLGLSHRTLDGYRVSGDGPAFHRFGNRVTTSNRRSA